MLGFEPTTSASYIVSSFYTYHYYYTNTQRVHNIHTSVHITCVCVCDLRSVFNFHRIFFYEVLNEKL